MMFSFQSGQRGHSTNTIILKSNEHKSYAWVFDVICTFQSSQFFERLSMHFGVVDHIRASALTTADRRPPSWNRITDSTHAPPVGNGIGEPHCMVGICLLYKMKLIILLCVICPLSLCFVLVFTKNAINAMQSVERLKLCGTAVSIDKTKQLYLNQSWCPNNEHVNQI